MIFFWSVSPSVNRITNKGGSGQPEKSRKKLDPFPWAGAGAWAGAVQGQVEGAWAVGVAKCPSPQ